jgi:lysophospholipase L1-like esterase
MFLRRALLAPAALAASFLVGQTPTPAQAGGLDAARRDLLEWRKSMQSELMDDWAQRARFRDANAKVPPPAAGEERVVFMGDSITELWNLTASYPGHPYVNRGISGQASSQMLLRFRQDVIDLKPRAVVILAGTNDIAGNAGPTNLTEIEGNLASMAELATAHGIRVVLCTVLPVNDDHEEGHGSFLLRPLDQIKTLNRWISAYAKTHHHALVDYYQATVDERGLLRNPLSDDGLHPNAAGYKVMAPMAEAAVKKVLGH